MKFGSREELYGNFALPISRKLATLENAFIFLFTFWHRVLTCWSSLRPAWNVMHRSSTLSDGYTVAPFASMHILLLFTLQLTK